MHGGPNPAAGRYHILIVLFDSKTGELIRDAQVRATVSEPGLTGQEKKLEPMKINQTLTYGNYFDMPGPGPYVIVVNGRRSAGAPPIEARLEHRHQ